MNKAADPKNFPEIVESYRDFVPPPFVRGIVETLLGDVPEQYLAGLKTIVLANKAGLSRDQKRQKVWSRNHRIRLAEALGPYCGETRSSPEAVWLYVDNVFLRFPGWFSRLPMVRHVLVGEVLYHEIGHHIHRVHRPSYEGRENVAEEWSRRLTLSFIRRRYWYIWPALVAVGWVTRRFRKDPKPRAASSSAML